MLGEDCSAENHRPFLLRQAAGDAEPVAVADAPVVRIEDNIHIEDIAGGQQALKVRDDSRFTGTTGACHEEEREFHLHPFR